MTDRMTAFNHDSRVAMRFFISDCANCGIVFAITEELEDRRRKDKGTFWCPNGHTLHFGGKTDEQKLKEATARETALKDQLAAAVHDTEQTRQHLLRDRQRFANGVCPCCNRSFENVRRHMSTKHPDYDPTQLVSSVEFKCSCGKSFETLRGLRIHQGHVRPDDWVTRGQKRDSWSRRSAHLTEVGRR